MCATQRRQGVFQRIYHFHAQKTAGTTISFAFLSNCCDRAVEDFYRRNCLEYRVIREGRIAAGWNVRVIRDGNYNYAISHEPFHRVRLQGDTFTFTCLRDPLKRAISHYNMLTYFSSGGQEHPGRRQRLKVVVLHFYGESARRSQGVGSQDGL